MSADWMPKSKEEQLILARRWLDMFVGHGAEWTEWEVSREEVAELAALTAAAGNAQKHAVKNGNPALAREAFHALAAFMRVIRRRRFAVIEEVDCLLIPRGPRVIEVDFWQKGAAHKAKPKGYDGAVVVWGVIGKAPEHPQDLVHHALADQTPYPIHFEEGERRKTVIVALAWHNRRGVLGRWTEYKTALVP